MAGPHVIEYMVRPDCTVVDVQGEWDTFATENDAADLTVSAVVGHDLREFLGGAETRLIYQALIERILGTGRLVRFPFRCDSPDARRYMEMEIERPDPDLIRFRSRMIREEDRPAQPLFNTKVARSDELLVTCSWCKRVKTEGDVWVEVEDYVASSGLMEADVLPRLTHGVCPDCEESMDALIESAE